MTALEVPAERPAERADQRVAVPYLVDQALDAQSAEHRRRQRGDVHRPYGFAQSLKSALVAAGLA